MNQVVSTSSSRVESSVVDVRKPFLNHKKIRAVEMILRTRAVKKVNGSLLMRWMFGWNYTHAETVMSILKGGHQSSA
jgi:hypothetical protein